MGCCWRSSYQEGRVGTPLTDLSPTTTVPHDILDIVKSFQKCFDGRPSVPPFLIKDKKPIIFTITIALTLQNKTFTTYKLSRKLLSWSGNNEERIIKSPVFAFPMGGHRLRPLIYINSTLWKESLNTNDHILKNKKK